MYTECGSYHETARRVGRPYTTVHSALSGLNSRPGVNERKRQWDRENYRGECEECGVPTATRHVTRCLLHTDQRRGHEERVIVICDMWADGCTLSEIAETLDTTTNTIGTELAKLRAKGYPLAHRRPPHVIEWARELGHRNRKAAA